MRLFAREYPELLRLISAELQQKDAVLEMACGTGIISQQISPLGQRETATDISPAMIAVAAAKAQKLGLANIAFSVQDGYALDFADDSFDAVIIANALHVIPEPLRMLKEAGRVLQPQGKLLTATYCHGENMKTRFLFWLLHLTGFRAWREFTSKSFGELVAAAGFAVEKTRLLHIHFPLIYVVARPFGYIYGFPAGCPHGPSDHEEHGFMGFIPDAETERKSFGDQRIKGRQLLGEWHKQPTVDCMADFLSVQEWK